MSYFTVANPKTEKGELLGYRTHILHLAPGNKSGYEVCASRSPECTSICLDEAGRGRFDRTQRARIRKTIEFFEKRQMFLSLICKEIEAGIKSARKAGLTAVFRLNGTSDIRWELYGIPQKYPEVQFYDYTKHLNRKNIPANYYLTFSRSEKHSDSQIREILKSGMNVAVVFNQLPDEYLGYSVVDGDVNDLRFLDPSPRIVGLTPKGFKAKKHSIGGMIL